MSETSSLTGPIVEAFSKMGIFAMRLNSGTAKRGRYYIKLCPPGTADVLAFPFGWVMWVETKDTRDLKRKGSTADAQDAFGATVRGLGHVYVRATCLDDVLRVLQVLRKESK